MTEEPLNMSESKQHGNEFLSNYRNLVLVSRISTTSPLLIFPLLSFLLHDWWLLFGILFAYLGGFLSVVRGWLVLVFILTVTYSLIYEFKWNSYPNIFFLCYLYGHITFSLGRYMEQKLERTKSKIENQVENEVSTMLKPRQDL